MSPSIPLARPCRSIKATCACSAALVATISLPHLLYPFKTWRDKADFDQTARKLVRMFRDNFVRFEGQVDADVKAAAPEVRIAAE